MYRTLAHGVLVSVPGRRGPLHVRYAFSRVDFEVATSTQRLCCCLSWLYLGRATSGGNSEQPSPSLCALYKCTARRAAERAAAEAGNKLFEDTRLDQPIFSSSSIVERNTGHSRTRERHQKV